MAHIHEKIDFTVDVFIVHKDRVLLRKHEKYKIWLVPGGHIQPDEDPNEAVIREAKEEVGLDIRLWDGTRRFSKEAGGNIQLIPPVSLNRHKINDAHEHVSMVYFATTDSDDVHTEHEEDRSDEWCWLKKDELDTLDLRSDIRFFAELALDTLGSA